MTLSTPIRTRTALCPRCFAQVEGDHACSECGLEFVRWGDVLDTLGPQERERRAAEVEDFYSVSPFPGYQPADDAGSVLDRARRSGFLRALDAAIPANARVLDAGCGTGNLAAFLALSAPRRTVFGIDGCKASLHCADEFARRVGAPNLQFVRGDLFDLPAADRSFDFVNCRGVVHHTPDPDGAIASVARLVAPGGVLVLGFYETWGRSFHVARRVLSRAVGRPVKLLDPILRRRDISDEKKRIWIDDQYRHPLEHILPMPAVLTTLEGLGFEWVRSVPPLPQSGGLFDPVPKPSAVGRTLLRTGWALAGPVDEDAGLVALVVRRRNDVVRRRDD